MDAGARGSFVLGYLVVQPIDLFLELGVEGVDLRVDFLAAYRPLLAYLVDLAADLPGKHPGGSDARADKADDGNCELPGFNTVHSVHPLVRMEMTPRRYAGRPLISLTSSAAAARPAGRAYRRPSARSPASGALP